MQIREQGRQVQLIRAPYDPEKRRCVQKVIEHFQRQDHYESDIIADYLSADKMKSLSEEEKAELAHWLKCKVELNTAAYRERCLNTVASTIRGAVDAMESLEIKKNVAYMIWSAIEEMTKALEKAGHKRSSDEREEKA